MKRTFVDAEWIGGLHSRGGKGTESDASAAQMRGVVGVTQVNADKNLMGSEGGVHNLFIADDGDGGLAGLVEVDVDGSLGGITGINGRLDELNVLRVALER